MRLTVSRKILFITNGVLVFTAFLSCLITISIFRKAYINLIDENVVTSERGAKIILEDWSETLEAECKMVSAQRALLNDMEAGNYSAVQDMILKQSANSENDHLMVADITGKIVAGNTSVGKSVASSKAFRTAMTGGQVGYQWYSSETLPFELLYACPMVNNDKIVGVLLTGFDFSASYRSELLKEAFSSEFTFFRDDLRVSSTLKNEHGGEAVGTRLENSEIKRQVLTEGRIVNANNKILGWTYRCIYSPLKDQDGSIEGMLFAGKSQRAITETVWQVVRISAALILAIFIVIAFISTLVVKKIIVKPLLAVKDSLMEISSGDADLTQRIDTSSKDEIGDVVNGFNAFVEKLQTIISAIKKSNSSLEIHGEKIGDISEDTSDAINQIVESITAVSGEIDAQTLSVNQTAGAVNQISSNIESLNKMIEGQTSGISEASAAVEEMIGNITSVNNSVEKMANSFAELNANADIGFKKQQDVNEKVQQIEAQSAMLEDANQAIAAIAAQTNLLAMNAAIEAAHAGDAGKGFSVVADEIRKLSETSSGQSKTIGQQLSKIRESIQNVVTASNESSDALGVVANKIRDTDQLVLQIRTAMEEQTEGSKQINEALKNMNDGSIEVRNASEEMTEGNKLILDEVRRLQEATSTMKEGMNAISDNTDKISETGAMLNDITGGLKESIVQIGHEINQFKV